MPAYLVGLLATALAVQSGSAPPAPTPAPSAKKASEIRLTGCISRERGTPGQITFLDKDGGAKYRLTGKGLKDFVGQQVEIVGGPPGKGVTFRTGLFPSPNTAAQAGALDPAQISIARMPGGAADAPGSTPLPEFRVVRVRGVEGTCQ